MNHTLPTTKFFGLHFFVAESMGLTDVEVITHFAVCSCDTCLGFQCKSDVFFSNFRNPAFP